MKKKIVLYGSFTPTMLQTLQQSCPEGFETYHVAKGGNLNELSAADYMVCRAAVIDGQILDHAPKLRAIQKWGVGYDKIDVEEAGRRGIPVMITVGGNSMPVAELTVTLMLDVLRSVTAMHEKLKEGNWTREQYSCRAYLLHGKTVGLVGIGNIAKKVAAIVQGGFQCSVLYYDLFPLSPEDEEKLGVRGVSLDELFRQSDIISIHVPLLDSTRGMIDRSMLEKMKPNACLINTSRGGVLNEEDLIQALRAGTLLGAGLDTFCSEPLPADSPLLTMDNVVATPHCGGNTVDNDGNMAQLCMTFLQQYDAGDTQCQKAMVNRNFLP